VLVNNEVAIPAVVVVSVVVVVVGSVVVVVVVGSTTEHTPEFAFSGWAKKLLK